MFRCIIGWLTLTSIGWSIDTVKVVQSGRAFAPWTAIPVMSRGYLFFITHDSPELDVYAPDGQLAFATIIRGPDGVVPRLTDAAIDDHGKVAVGFVYGSLDTGFRGAIALLDHSGTQIGLISTDRYMPSHLCFCPDGAIWTSGWQRDVFDKRGREDSQDYSIIRRFNVDGRQTGAFVKRSSFPPGLSPGGGWGGRWGIRAGGDHIGAFLYSGKTGDRLVWLELDTSGNEVGRWILPPDRTQGFAFSKIGLFAVNVASDGEHRTSIWELDTLDKSTSTWKPISKAEYSWDDPNQCTCGTLMDADGDDLVIAKQRGAILEWIKP